MQGRNPASAVVLSTSTRVELERLEEWALRHTSTEDTLVLEASGNAFAVAARLRAIGREVEILDSHRAGKVGKVYCANGSSTFAQSSMIRANDATDAGIDLTRTR